MQNSIIQIMIFRIILFLIDCICLNQNQVGIFRCHFYQPIGKAALGEQPVHNFVALKGRCKFFGLPLFLQGRVDRHIHRFRMVLALAKEQPFVLIVHRSNVDLCVSLVVVAPVRANA